MITDINPMAVRESESSQRTPMPATASVGDTFSNVMANAAPAVGATVELNSGNYRSGAVAAAAMTGVAGATQNMTGYGPGLSPLLQTATPTPFATGGYSYTGIPYNYASTGTSYLDPYAATSSPIAGQSAAGVGQTMASQTLSDGLELVNVQNIVSNATLKVGLISNVMKAKDDSNKAILQNTR